MVLFLDWHSKLTDFLIQINTGTWKNVFVFRWALKDLEVLDLTLCLGDDEP